jgi:hypothetical protein
MQAMVLHLLRSRALLPGEAMTDLEAALEYARVIVEAPSRSMAKRLAMVHETALATQLLATVERAEKAEAGEKDALTHVMNLSEEVERLKEDWKIENGATKHTHAAWHKVCDERDKLRALLEKAEGALKHYADEDHYGDDFSPGPYRARAALKEIEAAK